jgi:hypothetical protein
MIGGDMPATQKELTEALLVAVMGLLAFCVGVAVTRLFRPPSMSNGLLSMLRSEAFTRPLTVATLMGIGSLALLWSYVFGYFGLVATTGADAGDAAGAVSAIGFLLTIAHVVAWNRFFLDRDRRFLQLGLISTLVMLTFGLFANSKGQVVAPFFYIALCSWGASGKFPVKLLLIPLLLYIFVAFPFVTASRLALQGGLQVSNYELAHATIDYLFSGQWLSDAADFNAIEPLGRGLLPYFALIVQQAGSTVEFALGRTLEQGFELLVPRALYPDKPDMNIGNWTAQNFGVVSVTDDLTNISPTYMGEFYMNFGLSGVLIAMFLLGMLAILIDRYFIVSRRSWIMPIAVGYVGWQESFVGHTILPFVKSAVLWIPVLLLVAHLLRRNVNHPIQRIQLRGPSGSAN